MERWLRSLAGAAGISAGLLLLIALRLEWISLLPAHSEAAHADVPHPADSPQVVQLTAEQAAAAGLQLAVAETRPIQPTRAAPGSITYDAARRLDVPAPVAGVVLQALVQPGDEVTASQPLAVISSPEIGRARDEVLQRQAERALAQKRCAFAAETAANVAQLLGLIGQAPAPDELEKALAGKPLGDYRERIVAPYSKLALAQRRLAGTGDLQESGALSRRTIEERQAEREVAAAQLAAACESARFAAGQERDETQADADRAERLLAVAEQALANLLGPFAERGPVDQARLSELVLLAPRAGRIEQRQAVERARVTAGEPLFVIADTSLMWVAAEIHERDWPALEVARGGSIAVRVPALAGAELTARVKFVGAQVDSDTRSAPLVAELPNPEGQLRPGMFVWCLIPLAPSRSALVAPPGAIVRHENQAFVFLPAGQNAFRRVDVQVGTESPAGVEILSGLEPGTQVVAQGAFFLKSALLLEHEE